MSREKGAGEFLHEELEKRTTAAFHTLFETKHLYQSMTVDIEELIAESRKLPENAPPAFPPDSPAPAGLWRATVEQGIRDRLAGQWDLDGFQDRKVPRYSVLEGHLRVLLPSIKAGCSRCKDAEAFHPVRCEDLCREAYNAAPAMPEAGAKNQLFACTYQCQRCMGTYEAFLVRRVGPKITLCGRAPIEFSDVPAYIPGPVRKHFANAAVAANAGQILPALFLLRTVIEQEARAKTGLKDVRPTDKVMDTYMEQLPENFRSQFPSLRSLYDDLSAAMHEAREDDELFRKAFAEIDRHFEARKVFNLLHLNASNGGHPVGRHAPKPDA